MGARVSLYLRVSSYDDDLPRIQCTVSRTIRPVSDEIFVYRSDSGCRRRTKSVLSEVFHKISVGTRRIFLSVYDFTHTHRHTHTTTPLISDFYIISGPPATPLPRVSSFLSLCLSTASPIPFSLSLSLSFRDRNCQNGLDKTPYKTIEERPFIYVCRWGKKGEEEGCPYPRRCPSLFRVSFSAPGNDRLYLGIKTSRSYSEGDSR